MKVRHIFDERGVNFSEKRCPRQDAWGLPNGIRRDRVDRTIGPRQGQGLELPTPDVGAACADSLSSRLSRDYAELTAGKRSFRSHPKQSARVIATCCETSTLWSHAAALRAAALSVNDLVRAARELDQQRARIAGIDDLLHAARLGG